MPRAFDIQAPIVVVGAGPHGLSVAAHLRGFNLPVRVFGDPMGFWRDTMPAGMFLRSPARASSVSDPTHELSLRGWNVSTGRGYGDEMPLRDFIDYGMWFAARAVPDLDRRKVSTVRLLEGSFEVVLDDGETLSASRVVVAAGLGPFAHRPPVFADVERSLAFHASEMPSVEEFAERSVAVIGSGQSALESAALLHEAGAEVEVISRCERILWLNFGWRGGSGRSVLPAPALGESAAAPSASSWRARNGLYWHGAPTEVGGRFSSWVGAAPDFLRHLPPAIRAPLTYRCIRPAGASWLPDRLREVGFTVSRTVVDARARGGRLRLLLDDGSEREVDGAVLGTGYQIDVRKYPFLSEDILRRLRVQNGSPLLGRGMESSVPGLHFVGAPAAQSFGPVMRFVVGTAYTGRAVSEHLHGRRTPAFRWAF